MSPVPAEKKFKYIKNHMLTLIHARYCPNPPGTCKGFGLDPKLDRYYAILNDSYCMTHTAGVILIQLIDSNPMKVSHCAEFKAILIHIQDCCDPYMMCQEKYCVTSQQYMR